DTNQAALSSFQERIEVKGSVTDSLGNPLPGVSIVVEGMPQLNTFSNTEGTYLIQVPAAKANLVFSMVGYAPHTVAADESGTYDVVLRQGATDLDEVVVVGYGTQRKINLTGAVDKVD